MQDQPNERRDADVQERQTDAAGGVGGDVGRDGQRTSAKLTQSKRWVQLAYDLEQYGGVDPENRGEVF